MEGLRRGPTRQGAHATWAEGILLAAVLGLLASRLVPQPPPGPIPPAEDLVHRVDLNRAEVRDLLDLPGIGEARARGIVADRGENGPFRSARDLLRVRGIGPATVDAIEAFVKGETR